jgi:hypothetical protein
MIAQEDLGIAKNARLQKLIGTLEDQDKMLEVVIKKMPKSDEKQDLIEVKNMLIEFMGKVDGMLSVW